LITYFVLFSILKALEQSETELMDEILKAHVICIVYAVNDDETIEKIGTYWLPFVRTTLGENHRIPVILVGNKSDLVDYTTMDVSKQGKQTYLFCILLRDRVNYFMEYFV